MKIVCRNDEVKILNRILASKKPEFLAIYGRRRVGKTYLIRSFFENKKAIFFSVMGTKDGSYKMQVEHFIQRIGEVFLGGIIPKSVSNWDKAFNLLTEAINNLSKDKKVVLFLDELPWMATKKSKLLETIDYYWNQYWSLDKRIKLIVCGSSASWIIDKIINNQGGLYNRITQTMHLMPFNLYETEQFLLSNNIKLNKKQVTEIYMVTGGIPFYLSKMEPGLSSTQIIESLAFSEKGLLLKEFDNLFSSIFEDGEACVEIIKIIAKSREGIGQEDLFKKLKKTAKGNTGLSRLKALENAGFIISFTPHFHKRRGIFYKIIDEYTWFYLNWIAPIRSSKMSFALEKGYWKTISQTPAWYSWAGYAFEMVCYKHLKQIRRALQLSPTSIPNAWRYTPSAKEDMRGTQIDLLFDRDDDSITICEIKYTDKLYVISKEYAKNLKQKLSVFKEITGTEKNLFMALISIKDLKKNKYSSLIDNSVVLDELFRE